MSAQHKLYDQVYEKSRTILEGSDPINFTADISKILDEAKKDWYASNITDEHKAYLWFLRWFGK